MQLIFASQNRNKVQEIAPLLPPGITLLSLHDFSVNEELPETGSTLEANALQKAKFVFEKTGIPAFADDTGLEIYALDNRPGVYSARYAGEEKNPEANMEKVLAELKNVSSRSARFRTVIAFVNGNEEKFFEGSVEGEILTEKKGVKGFGYDPVFQPEGYTKSFAEMELEEKNKISHRARAFGKFVEFLRRR